MRKRTKLKWAAVFCGSVACLILLSRVLPWEPADAPVAHTGRSDSTDTTPGAPEAPDRSAAREPLEPTPASGPEPLRKEDRARERTLVFAGIVVNEDDEPVRDALVSCRGLRAREDPSGSGAHEWSSVRGKRVAADGSFSFTFPGGSEVRRMLVSVQHGPLHRALVQGFLPLGTGHVIRVPTTALSPGALKGKLIFHGGAIERSLLRVDHRGRTCAVQLDCEGYEVDVEMIPLPADFEEPRDAVSMSLNRRDDGFPYVGWELPSWRALATRLAEGIHVELHRVRLAIPPLASDAPAERVRIRSAVPGGRRGARQEVLDGAVELVIADGSYWIDGVSDAAGLRGRGKLTIRDGRPGTLEWGYVAPGPHSQLVSVTDHRGEPEQGVGVEAVLVEPASPDVAPRWFRAAAETDARGEAHLPGLLAGEYVFELVQAGATIVRRSGTVPGPPLRVRVGPVASVRFDLDLPVGIQPVRSFDVWMRRLDAGGDWRKRVIGFGGARSGGLPALLLPLVPHGRCELVCIGGGCFGHALAKVGPHAARTLRVTMQVAERIAGRVVDEEGEPVAGARVELAYPAWSGLRLPGCVTDADGRFSNEVYGPATLVVRSGEGDVIARRAAEGREMTVVWKRAR